MAIRQRRGRISRISVFLLSMALVFGLVIPSALATPVPADGIAVSKTAEADPSTALQWNQRLDVTGEPRTVDVLFIFDTSLSMAGCRLESVKWAAKGFIDALNGFPNVSAQFAVAYFNSRGFVASSSYSSDAAQVKGWIDGLCACGGTNLAAGLMAGRSIPGTREEAEKYAILLSDGLPTLFAVSDADTYYYKDWVPHEWIYKALATGYDQSHYYAFAYSYDGSDYVKITDPDCYFARLEGAKLKSAGFYVYSIGLELFGDPHSEALLGDISSSGSAMMCHECGLVCVFESILWDLLLSGTDGYVVDQVPSYLDIVAGSFVESVNGTPTGTAPDVTLDYMGVPNQFRWNLTGGDIDPGVRTLTFTVLLNGTYAGGPTASLLLNESAVLNYTDMNGTAQAMSFTPMPTGVVPGIGIEKTASKATALPGETITYTFTVTNLTGAPLSGVTVTDPMFPAEPQFSIGTLNTSTSFTVDYLVPAEAVFPIVNTASVTGYWMYPAWTASDSDTATVDRTPDYALSITKTADKTEAFVGDTVHYTLHVENTGSQPLTGIGILDLNNFGYAVLPAYSSTLAAGASFDVEYDLVMADNDPPGAYTFSNTAQVWCDQVTEPEESDWDVEVSLKPVYAVSIDKSVTTETTEEGLVATYSIKVKNTGEQPLAAVLVKDEALGFSQTVALAVGEEKSWTLPPVTYTAAGTYVNTATAEDPNDPDLFAMATDGVSFTYIPEEEPPEDNPDTGQHNDWLYAVCVLALVISAVGAIWTRKRLPVRSRR